LVRRSKFDVGRSTFKTSIFQNEVAEMNFLIRLASSMLGIIALVSILSVAGVLFRYSLSGTGLALTLPFLVLGIIAGVSSDRLYRYSKRPPPELRGFDVLPPQADTPADRKDA
jgi:hypothetical protein